jgi:hypothetical protein
MPLLVVTMVIQGCGVGTMGRAMQLSRNGDCAGAEAEYRNDPMFQQAPGKQALYIGMLYNGCYKQPDAARAYFTLAARHGEQFAPGILRKMGAPVPPVDLPPDNRPFTVMDGLRAAESGIQEQRATRAAPIPVRINDAPATARTLATPIVPTAAPSQPKPMSSAAQALVSAPGTRTSVDGDRIVRSDGLTGRVDGDMIFLSNGQTIRQSGVSAFRSDGVSATGTNISTTRSDGLSCVKVGDQTNCQ